MSLKAVAFLMCTLSMTTIAQDQKPKIKADVIFLHGNIYSGAPSASSFHIVGRSQALALRGDRVLAVGSEEEIGKLRGPDTQIVYLGGHFVMPGFNDAHLHISAAGFEKQTVNLVGAKSLGEFRDRIRAKVETAAPGEWITGAGWDQTLWPVKELPSRWDLDEVTGDHPAFF